MAAFGLMLVTVFTKESYGLTCGYPSNIYISCENGICNAGFVADGGSHSPCESSVKINNSVSSEKIAADFNKLNVANKKDIQTGIYAMKSSTLCNALTSKDCFRQAPVRKISNDSSIAALESLKVSVVEDFKAEVLQMKFRSFLIGGISALFILFATLYPFPFFKRTTPTKKHYMFTVILKLIAITLAWFLSVISTDGWSSTRNLAYAYPSYLGYLVIISIPLSLKYLKKRKIEKFS